MAGIKRTEADRWCSLAIRQRDRWTCRYCNTVYQEGAQGLDAAHIYGRAIKSTRWHAPNIIALCRYCHQKTGESPLMFVEWLSQEFSIRARKALRHQALTILKTNPALRAEVSAHYRAEYKRMTKGGTHDLVGWEL